MVVTKSLDKDGQSLAKWQMLSFISIFLLVVAGIISTFQYLSLDSLRTEVNQYHRSVEELNGRLNQTLAQLNAERGQLQYYKESATYYMEQAQSYQQKLLEERSGTFRLSPGVLRGQIVAPSVRVEGALLQRLIGVPMTMTVEIRPGEGRVFVNTDPMTGMDLQASVRTAAQVASYVTGFSLVDRDISLTVKAPVAVEVVDGPSAGGALTVLLIALIKGLEIRPDVMMTGTIDPSGKIGPVGGIIAKAEAASDGGMKVFIIPKGQSKQVIYREVVRQILPKITITTIEPFVVDIREYAREKWKLSVIEAANIGDALAGFVITKGNP